MPRPFPECPLFVPCNCSDYRNPRVCALVREDRRCLHRAGGRRERILIGGPGQHESRRYCADVLARLETRRPKGTEHWHMRTDRGWRELDE